MSNFLKCLAKPTVMIADGATGTMLLKAGLPVGTTPERWNLDNQEAVFNHYKSYIDAGSDIILTNTFGGSPIRLEREGLADEFVTINQQAANIARQAASQQTIIFGDIGPIGELIEPLGSLKKNAAEQAFAQQAQALVEGGVDAILIETMSDITEAKAAIKGVKQVTDLPIIVSFSFDTRGRTMMGVKPARVIEEIWSLGVTAVGANCGRTLSETLTAIHEMRGAGSDAVLFAKPNAGLPRTNGSELVYDVSPEIMADYAVRFAEAGVKIFGGCCGSTPEHIRAVANILKKQLK